jgi:hypothetical protein
LLASLLLCSLPAGVAALEERPPAGKRELSAEAGGGGVLRAATWVKERLSGFRVTPARLLVGVGLLGVLLTWSKNKRRPLWAVLAGLAWLLLVWGAAALLLGWRPLA